MTNYRSWQVTERTTISEADRHYLAGLIDGEGSIMILGSNPRRPHPFIVIPNTEKALVEEAMRIFPPFSLYMREHSPKKPQWKKCYVVKLSGIKSIHELCCLLNGYLRSPKKQRLLALMKTYCENRMKTVSENHRLNPRLTDFELALVGEIKKLNHK
jgi:hypothetical protein